MIAIPRSDFDHSFHPHARRRPLLGKRCAGRAGHPMDKASQTIGIDPNVKITS